MFLNNNEVIHRQVVATKNIIFDSRSYVIKIQYTSETQKE